MRRKNAGSLFALCLFIATFVRAGNGSIVVSHPPPAVTAMMSFDSATCSWTVDGHVNPAFKGFGGVVSLVCMPFSCLANGGNCTPEVVGNTQCRDLNTGSSSCTGID